MTGFSCHKTYSGRRFRSDSHLPYPAVMLRNPCVISTQKPSFCCNVLQLNLNCSHMFSLAATSRWKIVSRTTSSSSCQANATTQILGLRTAIGGSSWQRTCLGTCPLNCTPYSLAYLSFGKSSDVAKLSQVKPPAPCRHSLDCKSSRYCPGCSHLTALPL